MPELFYRQPRNAIAIFTSRSLLRHTSAVALTIAIVTTGADWAYYRLTRAEAFFVLARPALRLGMFMPILGPLVILLPQIPEFEAAVARVFHAGGLSHEQPPVFREEPWRLRNIDSSTPTN